MTTIPDELDGALVAAVDDSPPSREALRCAATFAVESRRPLHVVTVWNFVMGPVPADRDHDFPPSEAQWQAEAERRLVALVTEELGGRDGLDVRAWALHGNTIPTLLEVTRRARHLVVGTRGRGGFTGLLLGSTTDQLLHHACCPVTVVRHGCSKDAS
jgi:nucleotide-binding universal stress UspA family protein